MPFEAPLKITILSEIATFFDISSNGTNLPPLEDIGTGFILNSEETSFQL
jgi:hypothetical protein